MVMLQLKVVSPSIKTCSSITCWKKLLLHTVVFDAIWNAGMVISDIDITLKMVDTDRQSNVAYKAALEAKQRNQNSRR